MRNRWVRGSSERNKTEVVKRYFNTFASQHPGYKFMVAKKFNGMYDVSVTAQQCSEIKRHLERAYGLAGCLKEAPFQEVSLNDCIQKSFRNTQEFRDYRERTLLTMNRPLIRAKHAEAKQHYDKVNDVFTKSFDRSTAFKILCFDIEMYEHNYDIMLEIGYVIGRFTPVTRFAAQENKLDVDLITKRHLIIKENLSYKNNDRVPDNRYGFKFGSSETLSTADAVKRLLFIYIFDFSLVNFLEDYFFYNYSQFQFTFHR